MKKFLKLLAFLILIVVAFSSGKYYREIHGHHIEYVSSYFTNTPYRLKASGLLIPTNYRSQMFVYIHVECEHDTRSCIIITGPQAVRDERSLLMRIDVERPATVQYDSAKILVKNAWACKDDFWTIDLISEKVHLESRALSPEQQQGDCSASDGEPRSAFIGGSSDWNSAYNGKKGTY